MSIDLELHSTAVHEAGHAVVGVWLGLAVKRVSIEPDSDTLGRVIFGIEDLMRLNDCAAQGQRFEHLPAKVRGKLEDHLIANFAGPTAEATFRKRRRWLPGHETDLATAVDLADLFMSRKSAEQYVRWLCERSRDYVMHPQIWPAILALARELLAAGSVPGRRVAGLVGLGR